jgi:hypothetical protein
MCGKGGLVETEIQTKTLPTRREKPNQKKKEKIEEKIKAACGRRVGVVW